jgi:hypothetical protein
MRRRNGMPATRHHRHGLPCGVQLRRDLDAMNTSVLAIGDGGITLTGCGRADAGRTGPVPG